MKATFLQILWSKLKKYTAYRNPVIRHDTEPPVSSASHPQNLYPENLS
jgi:hypothetical protein